MKKTIVIHHSADYDGLFCREVAKKFLPTDTEFIGWDYGNPKICLDGVEGTVYILDLSPECLHFHPNDKLRSVPSNVIWIDHHKSAIEQWDKGIAGYRIDGVAACRLAYQWFLMHSQWDPREQHPPYGLPVLQDYIDRRVAEPLAVRLAGEYDIWDKRDPRAEWFQFGLDGAEVIEWGNLLDQEFMGQLVGPMCMEGCKAKRVVEKRDADIMTRSFMVNLFGLKFLALNIAKCNSNTFASKDVPATGHDALLAFYWNGKEWNYSMYHAKHNTTIDLSAIAKSRGGGGHRGACGFKTPFLIPALTGQKEGPCS